VPVHLRRSLWPTALLCAALALALLSPVSASASSGGGQSSAKQTIRAQKRAAREAQRAARKQQRAERKDAKKAAREVTRGERQAEREARRAAREAERTDRPGTTEAPTSTEGSTGEPTPGETGQKAPAEPTPQAPPSGTGTQSSLTPRSGCTLTVAPSAAQVTVGETVALSGKLSCPAGIEVAGREVTIDQREASAPGAASASSTSLAPVDTATTAEDGSYEFHSAALTGRSTFVVRSTGVRHPARTVVRVGAGMTLESSTVSGSALALSSGKAGAVADRLAFSGVVQPAAAGVGVGLRVRYAGGDWRTVAFAHTDAEGHYTFSHRFRAAGIVEVVTVSHPHGEQRTESTPLSYTIGSPTSPSPTSESSGAAPTPAPSPTAPTTPTTTPTTPA
jgi:hypothetical protein